MRGREGEAGGKRDREGKEQDGGKESGREREKNVAGERARGEAKRGRSPPSILPLVGYA